jgi:hypothetical protein
MAKGRCPARPASSSAEQALLRRCVSHAARRSFVEASGQGEDPLAYDSWCSKLVGRVVQEVFGYKLSAEQRKVLSAASPQALYRVALDLGFSVVPDATCVEPPTFDQRSFEDLRARYWSQQQPAYDRWLQRQQERRLVLMAEANVRATRMVAAVSKLLLVLVVVVVVGVTINLMRGRTPPPAPRAADNKRPFEIAFINGGENEALLVMSASNLTSKPAVLDGQVGVEFIASDGSAQRVTAQSRSVGTDHDIRSPWPSTAYALDPGKTHLLEVGGSIYVGPGKRVPRTIPKACFLSGRFSQAGSFVEVKREFDCSRLRLWRNVEASTDTEDATAPPRRQSDRQAPDR